jgi:hypothetical protein
VQREESAGPIAVNKPNLRALIRFSSEMAF